ncbi:DUF3718 domain-containing protein [Thalassotalea nanhaiensis]|mgnify:CR=1 FL=1|uniref:DUF3718 domain-containing protein n=1 Tax=Thalassotalea nanhaiensis TaxID=3065648 RepID=A0ABY9TM49_9GAMM|nr:DUF3718 domain-containing protein [Colwelliaceae bacterium SQ345]
MTFTKLSILALLIGATPVTLASQYKFVATDKDPNTKICIAAAENNLLRYMRLVKHHGFTYQVIADHLKCNEQNIADFAYSFSSTRTAKFIDAYRKDSTSFSNVAVHSPSQINQGVKVIYITAK